MMMGTEANISPKLDLLLFSLLFLQVFAVLLYIFMIDD